MPNVQSLGFTYDVGNRITQIGNGIDTTLSQNYGYDDESRLVSVYSGADNESFQYDANGNRISQTVNGAALTFTISPTSNQVTAISGASSATYGYDGRGNTTDQHLNPGCELRIRRIPSTLALKLERQYMAAKILGLMVMTTFAMIFSGHAEATSADTPKEIVIDRANLSATVYRPGDGKPHPALLILGGAEGGRNWADAIAKRLADEGYVTMAETYFKGPGLPDQLENIPLERFQAAVDYLAAQPFVKKKQIAVIGLSKGAEAALVLASHDARLTAVVAASPSDVVWQGIDRKGGSAAGSWTFHGKTLAYVPFRTCSNCKGLLDLYQKSREAEPIDPAAVIAVERINGPVLLISSATDKVWPSTAMAHSIVDRLRHAGFAFRLVEADYPEGGHFAFGVTPTRVSATEDTQFGGGTPEGLAKARKDSWELVSKFLASAFATTH